RLTAWSSVNRIRTFGFPLALTLLGEVTEVGSGPGSGFDEPVHAAATRARVARTTAIRGGPDMENRLYRMGREEAAFGVRAPPWPAASRTTCSGKRPGPGSSFGAYG